MYTVGFSFEATFCRAALRFHPSLLDHQSTQHADWLGLSQISQVCHKIPRVRSYCGGAFHRMHGHARQHSVMGGGERRHF